jgi:uncharacterized membrane protein YccC
VNLETLVVILFVGAIVVLALGLWASVRSVQAYDRVSTAVFAALARSDELQARRDLRASEQAKQLEHAYAKAIAHAAGEPEPPPMQEPPPKKTFTERFLEQEQARGNGRRGQSASVPDELA